MNTDFFFYVLPLNVSLAYPLFHQFTLSFHSEMLLIIFKPVHRLLQPVNKLLTKLMRACDHISAKYLFIKVV